ncbi:MAG: site-specific integrase [marine benthic group bacterium]|nr:site-specific integrase [Candidatus Benthicola marisminoris]
MPKLSLTGDHSNVRDGFVTDGELRQLLPLLPRWLRPLVEFAYLTGWRRGEVVNLTWEQVDLAAGVIRLRHGTTKNDRAREISYQAHPRLRAIVEGRRSRMQQLEIVTPWVFFRPDGRAPGEFRRAWKRACIAAGHWTVKTDNEGRPQYTRNGEPQKVHTIRFHDLRRSAVRNMVRAGLPQQVAMQITGHTTPAVFNRYAIVDSVAQDEAMTRYAALDQEPAIIAPITAAGNS